MTLLARFFMDSKADSRYLAEPSDRRQQYLLHTRPNLCLIQLQQLFRSEVPPDLREDFKFFFCRNLCFVLDILPKVEFR